MVADLRFIPFPDSVRIVGPDAARRAGCAAGTWLDTPRGQMWETLVTPVPAPIIVRFPPGADLEALRREHPEAADRGILFIPEELSMPPSASARHFRLRASQQVPGGHVHVGIWAGTPLQAANRARPKLGQLTMDLADWTAFVRLMTWCPSEVVEVDTSGLLDVDGTGSADADMHLAGFRGYEGCPRRDCRTPGLCSGKGDCLEDDPDRTDRFLAGLVAEEVNWSPDVADPALSFTMPANLTRVWVALTGAATPRPGSTGWALTILVDDHPVNLVVEDWIPGVDPAPVRYGAWLYGNPGQTYRLGTRLDGADWVTSHLPRVAVTLTVAEQPPPRPGFPPTVEDRDEQPPRP